MFTKEIEEALAEGRVDLAVHSLKDLPTELPEPFALAATPPRVDPRDVLVSVKYDSLADLPLGARVGTSSQRRRAQLKALRPDIEAQEFRATWTRGCGSWPRGRWMQFCLRQRGWTGWRRRSGCASGWNPRIFVRRRDRFAGN